jgi:hypothetical protein
MRFISVFEAWVLAIRLGRRCQNASDAMLPKHRRARCEMTGMSFRISKQIRQLGRNADRKALEQLFARPAKLQLSGAKPARMQAG